MGIFGKWYVYLYILVEFVFFLFLSFRWRGRLIGYGDRRLKGFLGWLFFDFFKVDKYLGLYGDIIIYGDVEIFVIRYRCK